MTTKINKPTASTAQNIAKLLAIGTLATGAVAAFSAAPAGAVALNTGNLTISDGTSDFYASGNPNSYTVTFNPFNAAFSTGVTGSFANFFSNAGAPTITPSTGVFNRVGLTDTYSLASPLNFNFQNGVRIAFDTATFLRTFNNANGVGFINQTATARVINGNDSVNLQVATFNFSDGNSVGGGGYNFTVAPVAVPEPFTIIGTMLGGAAALRMRKRLKAENKL
jgi:hypothetical protein